MRGSSASRFQTADLADIVKYGDDAWLNGRPRLRRNSQLFAWNLGKVERSHDSVALKHPIRATFFV